MDCREAREMMSDYMEQSLAEPAVGQLEEHLGHCDACRREYEELSSVFGMVHALPRQKPERDLWREFEPEFARIRAEMHPGVLGQARRCFSQLSKSLTEGWIIFVAAIRYASSGRVRRYT